MLWSASLESVAFVSYMAMETEGCGSGTVEVPRTIQEVHHVRQEGCSVLIEGDQGMREGEGWQGETLY